MTYTPVKTLKTHSIEGVIMSREEYYIESWGAYYRTVRENERINHRIPELLKLVELNYLFIKENGGQND